MEKQNFKKGDYVIRKWKTEHGGEIDFARFDKHDKISGEFYCTKYCRINGEKIDTRFPKIDSVNYTDSRMDYDFRLATKDEIKKYKSMLAVTPKRKN